MSKKYVLPVDINDVDFKQKPIDGMYTYEQAFVIGAFFVLGFIVSFVIPFSIPGFLVKVIIIGIFTKFGLNLIKKKHERFEMSYLDYLRYKFESIGNVKKTSYSYRDGIFIK